jgi:hypothetical protein
MHRYLVEVSQPEAIAAKRIVESVRSIGSHFATHAVWRPDAGRCTGSMVIDAVDRLEALRIVPPGMRGDARVISLETVPADRPRRCGTEPYPVAA